MTLEVAQLQSFRKDLLLGQRASVDAPQNLSLVAMLGKFERAVMPNAAVAATVALRPAVYPNDRARKAMLKLLSGRDGNVTDSMAVAVPILLKQHGLSLHPFDFARLEDFIARHGEQLSPDARDWLGIIRPGRKEAADDSYLDGPIAEEHLMQASKVQRIQYLRELRVRDPARARRLIEGMMPSEAAEMRLRLLKVLSHTPSTDDQAFLETLLRDRAPTVKDYALGLLSCIPGTENFARQLARLKDSLQIKAEGLLRRRKVFVYKGSEPKPGQDRFANLVGGLSLADIAGAFGEDRASLISIAMQSDKLPDLQLMLIRKAVDEREFLLAEKAAEQANGNDGELMSALIDQEFSERPEKERADILRLCFTPRSWKQLPPTGLMMQITSQIPPALPEDLAHDLIAHTGWSKLEDGAKKISLEVVAHLIPQRHSAEFMQMAEAWSPRAALYHRFISSLSQ
jgi:hypothetical protein